MPSFNDYKITFLYTLERNDRITDPKAGRGHCHQDRLQKPCDADLMEVKPDDLSVSFAGEL
jgi:hypothetical protein